MKRYAFYESDKFIGEYELYDETEAIEKAADLSYILSASMKCPKITYKEVQDGKKVI